MFVALLDTCVLWPSLQRDFLLSLAVEGLYRPVWSPTVLDELAHNERKKLLSRGSSPDEARRRSVQLISSIRSAFVDSEVLGSEALEGSYALPDPDDEHVVAAAVIGGAGAIVTNNFPDFPRNKVPPQIEILHPAVFAANTVGVDPSRARKAVNAIVARSGRYGPRLAVQEILEVLLHRYHMDDVVELLREA